MPIQEYMVGLEMDEDECPLRDEASYDEDDDNLDQFISLAHMCRDEQLFTTFFESLIARGAAVSPTDGGPPTLGEGSESRRAGERGSIRGECAPIKKRKRIPVVEAREVLTEHWNSSGPLNDSPTAELRNLESSDEDEEVVGKKGGRKKTAHRVFQLTNNVCPDWFIGDLFPDKESVFEALRQYGVMSRRPVYMAKNEKEKMRAKCHGAYNKCKWFVYWRKNDTEDFVVNTQQKAHAYTCCLVNNNRWISAKWLGMRYTEKIKANPHIPLQAIRQCVDEDFSSTLSRMKAYRTREYALEGIFGRAGAQYKKLYDYKGELLRTHPNSIVDIMHESHRDDPSKGPRFLRLYCCLGPLKRGWRDFCRPVVFLDACFLKGAYKGQLFTAVGMDQNDGWWPIAWGVAEAEGYIQWKWFLELLDVDLQLSENSPRYVFMSDQ